MSDFETHPRGTVEGLRAENERLRTLVRDVAEAWGDGHPNGVETLEQAEAVRDCQREALK